MKNEVNYKFYLNSIIIVKGLKLQRFNFDGFFHFITSLLSYILNLNAIKARTNLKNLPNKKAEAL
jgi:hypothetical protein